MAGPAAPRRGTKPYSTDLQTGPRTAKEEQYQGTKAPIRLGARLRVLSAWRPSLLGQQLTSQTPFLGLQALHPSMVSRPFVAR